MAITSASTRKGKARADPIPSKSQATSSSSDSDSESGSSSSSSESESEEEITPDYLESLLEKARQNVSSAAVSQDTSSGHLGEAEIIQLGNGEAEQYAIHSRSCQYLLQDGQLTFFMVHTRKLPTLDPGVLPDPYITPGATRRDAPARVRDLDAEQAEASSSALNSLPTPPVRPPSPSSRLTKKQQKAVRSHASRSTQAMSLCCSSILIHVMYS